MDLNYHLQIKISEFLMVGNSLKSDVLPLIEIGAQAVHIPFHTTWAHEEVSRERTNEVEFLTLLNAKELLQVLSIPS